MSRLLEGIRVIDLTNVLAGPFGAYQLALLGADVIKVEAPEGGDLARQLGADPDLNAALMGASFLAQNAGKRSVTVNLKSAAGGQVFRRLVRSADVVIENFRPGVMARLGLGYESLRQEKPGLVYCAISGFGESGPLARESCADPIMQAFSGFACSNGAPGDELEAFRFTGFIDLTTSSMATEAILAALYQREQTGLGHVDRRDVLERARRAVVVHADAVEQRRAGAARAHRSELARGRLDRLVHALARIREELVD